MIDSNREEFEKLPEIAERLHTVFYNEDLNQYHAATINSGLSVKYIHGAWYTFQEQQKKLDCCREGNNTRLEKIDDLQGRIDEALRHVVDHGGYDDLTHVISILKGNKDEI